MSSDLARHPLAALAGSGALRELNLPPSAKGAALWALHLDICGIIGAALEPLLSTDEVLRANRFLVPSARASYVQTRGVLRLLLAKRTGRAATELRFDYSAAGKPTLTG